MNPAAIAGFLLVDKPSGWTSHDVVAKVRSVLRIKKVGHAGTLDPMATGLLVLGIGRATRLLRYVSGADKQYVATARFGVATDTLDADGAILSREPMPVTADDVERVLPRFIGTISQVPPMVSALKVEGRRLYELAREGKTVERKARSVIVHDLRLTDFAPSQYPEATFEVRCGSGTYVRTLADDMARALGGRAHLSALRRTHIGALDVVDAKAVDDLRGEPAWIDTMLLSPARALADLPSVEIGDDLMSAISNGVAVAGYPFGNSASGPVRVLDETGRLLAVYRRDGRRATAEVVLS